MKNILMKKAYVKKVNMVKKQAGFTMLEILVALALGVAILTAAISMQFQHRKGFKLANGKLTMQTNAKFAIELMSQSLRSAGSMGCKSGIQLMDGQKESVTSSGTNYGTAFIALNNPQVAFADFRPGFEVLGYEYQGVGLVPSPPVDFNFVSLGHYNADSDMLTVSGAYGEVYPVVPDITDVAGSFNLEMSGISQVRLKQSQYGILSSCRGAKVFKVTSSNVQIGTGVIGWSGGAGADDNKTGVGTADGLVAGGSNLELRRAAVTTYFIGMHPFNDSNGVPTLYQDVDGVSKRLIDGIEEIQIEYGLSSSPSIRNIADRYVTADVVDAGSTPDNNLWAQVVSVRVGLIMRSLDEVYENDQTQNMSLACIDYTQATKTDKYARTTYCSEVSIRNRLTGARVGKKV